MPQRSVGMLLTVPEKKSGWRTAKRRCAQCSASFLPTRRSQRFCPGGDCRLAWWMEHQATEAHRCRCGRECAGPDPDKCRRPDCKGLLVRDDDGGSVCLFCGRPGDELALLQAVTAPAKREAVRVG